MANSSTFTKALVAASANNIALSQTPVSGTPLTINGSTASAGVATLDTQRRVLLTFGSEAAQRTLVVTGTNDSGNPISETLTIPATSPGTIATLQDFLTVTSMVPAGGGWSAAVTVGTNTTGSTPWNVVNNQIDPTIIQVMGTVLSGSATWSIEYTYATIPGMPGNTGNQPWTYPTPPAPVFEHATLVNQTGTLDGGINAPVTGWRLTITVGTGVVKCVGTQAGIAN